MRLIPFLLRDVPEQLHTMWGIMSKLRKLSMRAYALLALQAQVDRDEKQLEELKKKTKAEKERKDG